MRSTRELSFETLALFIMGAVFVGACAFICVNAYRATHSAPGPGPAPAIARLSPPLPPASPPVAFAPPRPASIFAPSPSDDAAPVPQEQPMSPPIALGAAPPLPPSRPIQLNARLAALAGAPMLGQGGPSDRFTAVYDLTAHVVYLPDGERLEAHSGLGSLRDDPAHVDEKDRGATPPHLYDLKLREDLFHGVQALRLNPVGGAASIFDRAGLLAHTYMLGPGGDSNGCVSFKNYDAFLQAFQSGRVKRLVVVSSLR